MCIIVKQGTGYYHFVLVFKREVMHVKQLDTQMAITTTG